MRQKKHFSTLILALVLIVILGSIFSGCKKETSEETSKKVNGKKVKINMLNSKNEIQAALEEGAKSFSKKYPNIELTVTLCPTGQSPFEKLSSMTAAGNAPTIAIVEGGDLSKFEKKCLDLSNEKWVSDVQTGMLDDSKSKDGKVIAFPFTVEGYGIMYNKAVLDKAKVDPATIKTRKDLEEAFKKVKKSTGKEPLELSPMDWSLGNHFLTIGYSAQNKDPDKVNEFMSNLKAGTMKLSSNAVMNGVLDTFDMMKNYNKNKKDVLSETYEKGAAAFGSGEVGFWFMGCWAGPEIDKTATGVELGFIPLPISNNANDYGNSQIPVGVTKFAFIDKDQNSEEQQKAAKQFLDWLVYEEVGQRLLVEKTAIIPAFKNITMEPFDAPGMAVKKYITDNKIMKFMAVVPADHWKVLGGSFQKYFAGKESRTAFFSDIEKYWKGKGEQEQQ